MSKRPSEQTIEEMKEEAKRLENRREQADREDSWMLAYQLSLDEMEGQQDSEALNWSVWSKAEDFVKQSYQAFFEKVGLAGEILEGWTRNKGYDELAPGQTGSKDLFPPKVYIDKNSWVNFQKSPSQTIAVLYCKEKGLKLQLVLMKEEGKIAVYDLEDSVKTVISKKHSSKANRVLIFK